MLVTRPAGKGPLGRMRAAEQSRTEHVYLAKLWVCRQRLCNGHCSLCLCTSELGCCALVCIPPYFCTSPRLVAYFVCRCMLPLACFVSRSQHIHINL